MTTRNLSALVLLAFLALSGAVSAEPLVDGTVKSGEYRHQVDVIDGTATVYWSPDAAGGLYLAVSAPTPGWVGLGLGSQVMDGASIYMGYVSGKPVFSEQRGRGHSHTPVAQTKADRSAVVSKDGRTVIEFHLPATAVPAGTSIPFITAYAGVPDLSTFHEDHLDAGTLTLP